MADVTELLRIFNGAKWMADAVCAQADPDAMYPQFWHQVATAKVACQSCPVRREGLDWAIDNEERHGVWGGMTPEERDAEVVRRVSVL